MVRRLNFSFTHARAVKGCRGRGRGVFNPLSVSPQSWGRRGTQMRLSTGSFEHALDVKMQARSRSPSPRLGISAKLSECSCLEQPRGRYLVSLPDGRINENTDDSRTSGQPPPTPPPNLGEETARQRPRNSVKLALMPRLGRARVRLTTMKHSLPDRHL